MRILKLSFVLLLAIILTASCSKFDGYKNCTILTASDGNTTFFANNEDYHEGELVIGFFPASANGYGSVHWGYETDGGIQFQGVVNDQGLAWDVNGLPSAKLNPHPEKRYSHEKDNYLSTISKKAASVEEAIQIADEFDFGDSLSIQVHIADSTGDAIVLSAGADGEIHIVRKSPSTRYLVSTNFNHGKPGNGREDWRYGTAVEMLENFTPKEYTMTNIGKVMEAVKLKEISTYTLYSNVIDLNNMKMHLYYMSQYDEMAEIDILKELEQGQRIIDMRTLFSPGTVEAGDNAYKKFEAKMKIAIIAVFVVGGIIITGIIILIAKRRKRKKHE